MSQTRHLEASAKASSAATLEPSVALGDVYPPRFHHSQRLMGRSSPAIAIHLQFTLAQSTVEALVKLVGAAIHLGHLDDNRTALVLTGGRSKYIIPFHLSAMSPWLLTFVAFVPVLLLALSFLRSTVLSKYLDDKHERRQPTR
jgi:hypothetical protein